MENTQYERQLRPAYWYVNAPVEKLVAHLKVLKEGWIALKKWKAPESSFMENALAQRMAEEEIRRKKKEGACSSSSRS